MTGLLTGCSNCNFGFVAEETVELGILENLDVSTPDTHRVIEVGALREYSTYFFEKWKAILNNHSFAFVVPEFLILHVASAYYTEKTSTHGHGSSKELLTR